MSRSSASSVLSCREKNYVSNLKCHCLSFLKSSFRSSECAVMIFWSANVVHVVFKYVGSLILHRNNTTPRCLRRPLGFSSGPPMEEVQGTNGVFLKTYSLVHSLMMAVVTDKSPTDVQSGWDAADWRLEDVIHIMFTLINPISDPAASNSSSAFVISTQRINTAAWAGVSQWCDAWTHRMFLCSNGNSEYKLHWPIKYKQRHIPGWWLCCVDTVF